MRKPVKHVPAKPPVKPPVKAKPFEPLNRPAHPKAPVPAKPPAPAPSRKEEEELEEEEEEKGEPMSDHMKKETHHKKEAAHEHKTLTLVKAIDEHDQILVVGNTAGLGPYHGVVEIDGEKIPYSMASTDSLHNCIRGEGGKGGSKHEAGAVVTFLAPEETEEEKEERVRLNVNTIEEK